MPEEAILAWSQEPMPNGKIYQISDLNKLSEISSLFGFCKNNTAHITPDGWRHLIINFKLEDLQSADANIHWLMEEKENDIGEFCCSLYFKAMISGYYPPTNDFGDFDQENNTFLFLDGSKSKIDWSLIYDNASINS
ncbi:hypothetical protein [Aureibacter tunicatorum]|uniref:Uncharacterized protein n=1 Tax=Aureibacter tunicatorum TaxID=866807 RepID=A0AAE4BSB5_9BACT|nr:hypothetical protein [Aureibacter tunicatorum]MDR6238678.1 hypothetical protein [Aureibacter tunicatorum]BDD05391.1 hypothetical protein AUTU_28740 [Aureibacter tunicatorum]